MNLNTFDSEYSYTNQSTNNNKIRRKIKVPRKYDQNGNLLPHKHQHKSKNESNLLTNLNNNFKTPNFDQITLGHNKKPIHIFDNLKDFIDDDPFSQFPDDFQISITKENKFCQNDDEQSDSILESYSDEENQNYNPRSTQSFTSFNKDDIISSNSSVIPYKNKHKIDPFKIIKNEKQNNFYPKKSSSTLIKQFLSKKPITKIKDNESINETIPTTESTGIYIKVTDTDADFIEISSENSEINDKNIIKIEQTNQKFIGQNISTNNCTLVEELVTATEGSAEFIEASNDETGVLEFIEITDTNSTDENNAIEPDTVQIVNHKLQKPIFINQKVENQIIEYYEYEEEEEEEEYCYE